jgi:hypothetical protein
LINNLLNEEYHFFINLCEKSIKKYNDLMAVKNASKDMLFYTMLKKCDNDYIMNKILKKEFDFITNDMEFENKSIGELFTIKSGEKLNSNQFVEGNYPVIGGGKSFKGYHNKYNTDENNIFIARVGDAGFVSYIESKCFCTDNSLKLTSITNNINKYVYNCLKNIENDIKNLSGKNGQPNINQTIIKNINIPIPSLKNQQIIVDYLDKRMEYHTNYWKTLFSFNLTNSLEYTEEDVDKTENNEITVV